MRQARALLRAGCIGGLMLMFAMGCYASDSDRITQLEKEVQELKARLANLEAPQATPSGRPKPAVSANGWTELANWRALKRDMSYEAVRGILGEPQRISGGGVANWEYPNHGRVTFIDDRLAQWMEPR